MLVKEVMSRDVITVDPDDTLSTLIEKLQTYNFHDLPVVDGEGRVLGVVRMKDIMKVFVPHNPALEKLLKTTHFYKMEERDILEVELPKDIGSSVKVADIMNTHFVSVEESESIADARNSMLAHNIQRLVVTRDEKLAGFITLFDMIVALFRERGIIK